ncbi:MAG: hypothetical protein R3B09_13270 [Nannocystaceae bacterium]
MTTLTIPISLICTEAGLELVFENERVLVDEYQEASLELEVDEVLVFEIADFTANGNTYRVNARSTTNVDSTAWDRLSWGCRSRVIVDPVAFTLEISAAPAVRTVATASTTSTTVIRRKGRPGVLLP